jgi:hypothetical protein
VVVVVVVAVVVVAVAAALLYLLFWWKLPRDHEAVNSKSHLARALVSPKEKTWSTLINQYTRECKGYAGTMSGSTAYMSWLLSEMATLHILPNPAK